MAADFPALPLETVGIGPDDGRVLHTAPDGTRRARDDGQPRRVRIMIETVLGGADHAALMAHYRAANDAFGFTDPHEGVRYLCHYAAIPERERDEAIEAGAYRVRARVMLVGEPDDG